MIEPDPDPKPRASVLVAGGAPPEALGACLAALARHTRPPWELIVADDGTSEAASAYLRGVRDSAPFPVRILNLPAGPGPAAALTRRLRAARGEAVVLLDGHAVVDEGWLDQLLALAGSGERIGAAGGMSNGAAPPQRVEAVPYADLAGLRRFAAAWRAEHRGRWLTCESLSGPCLLLNRRLLEALGGTDGPPEADLPDAGALGERARRAGFELAVACDLYVHDARALPLPPDRDDGGDDEARPAPPVGPRARVSLTMIVRDEEANLPACLGSAEGLFDEVVVVDTGSVDRTREIARARGARVFDFVWVDDFAAARNAALARATGDYAFWLDADDVLDPPEREKLRALLAGLRAGADEAAYVVRCACDPDAGGGGGRTVVDHVRLFPRLEGVRWAYAVHEQILPALRRAGVPVRWTDVTVRHTGYTDPALRGRKLERDAAILAAELAERPGDPFVLFNLGSIAVERRAWGEALGYLERSLASSSPGDSIVRKLYALIARAHQMLGSPGAALAACAEGLALDGDDAELLFRKAVLHRHRGEAAEAESCWRRILTLRRPEKFASVDAGIYGHLTRRNLAALAEERGAAAGAARLWGEVLAECPGDAEAESARRRLAGTGAGQGGDSS